MESRLNRIVVFSVLAGIIVIGGVLSLLFLSSRANSDIASPSPTTNSVSNPITRENAQQGTSNWKIPSGKESTIQIQAYVDATSVQPGQMLTFYVSTQVEGMHYSISIYRLGWYKGSGGRLLTTVTNQIGFAQGYYDQAHHHLVGCISCRVNVKTGLVEANWQISYMLTVPSDWVTGVYLAKFIDANGLQTYVPFDVQGNPQSLYIAVTPDTTYAAYNNWGGYSLYEADDNSKRSDGETNNLSRGVMVSFDRPYLGGYGSSQVLDMEADAIHWMERQGYDLSYISCVDLHEDPTQLLHHRAYLSLGHDEYWTKEMRDGVEYARNQGVSLAFLGADADYWQMRFEPDNTGKPDRTIVCYKVLTGQHDLARDPLYEKDNTRVTSQWRDPAVGRPENALIGIMYSNLIHRIRGFPWQLRSDAKSSLLDGTGLQPGQQYGCGLVGYEWDRIFANGATPRGLQVLSISHTVSAFKDQDFSNTTYYIAPSGAMVFATGSIYWTASLDPYRLYNDPSCANKSLVVPEIQKLMVHVMDALLTHHVS